MSLNLPFILYDHLLSLRRFSKPSSIRIRGKYIRLLRIAFMWPLVEFELSVRLNSLKMESSRLGCLDMDMADVPEIGPLTLIGMIVRN